MSEALISPEADELLDEVIGGYLAAVDQGNAPDPAQLSGKHPEISDELRRFFSNAARVSGWTAPLRAIAEAGRSPYVPVAGAGMRVGDYDLIEELGSGGMGVVYKARQRSLNRIVALKMIGAGRLCTTSERQRFRHEAETVARLDHPHIVPVYDVGEWSADEIAPSLPYFTMKLFPGGSLADCPDQFIAEPVTAVRVAIAIARAVHHAHQRGVLHRDLKPSNIVLDGDGQPHVADFGLAKRMARPGFPDASLTATGDLIGTPGYMAPEQVTGKPLTTVSDVYGVGAVLYVLLTGRAPFRGRSVLETLEQVRDRDPQPPLVLNPGLDSDLQAICLKCLAKRPEERYGSALALAQDLDAWLTGRPIQARPPSTAKRFWQWCRRNPVVAGLAGVAAVAIVVAITALVVGTMLIVRESEQKEAALQAEREQRQRAEAKEHLARRAVDDYMRVAGEWLVYQPSLTQPVREFLEKALTFYEELAREQSADRDVRFRTAQALHFLGRVQLSLGHAAESEQAYRRQITLLQALVNDFPADGTYRFDLFHAYHALGMVIYSSGESERCYHTALAIIRDLVRDFPEEPNYRDALAAVNGMIGGRLVGTKRSEEGEKYLHNALRIAEQLEREYPNKKTPPHYAAVAGQALSDLGRLHVATNRVRQGEDFYRQAMATYEKLAGDHVKEPEEPAYRQGAMGVRFELANLALNTGRPVEAMPLFEQCVAEAERLAREYPNAPSKRVGAAEPHAHIAYCLLASGRSADAKVTSDRYMSRLEDAITDFPQDDQARWHLVNWLCTFPIAAPEARARALKIAQSARRAPNDPTTLGMAYYCAGKWSESIEKLEKAPESVTARLFLAMAHWQTGHRDKAQQIYAKTAASMGNDRYTLYSDRCLQKEVQNLLQATK